MSDRTESLLAELIALQRRQLVIQEELVSGQRQAREVQRTMLQRQPETVGAGRQAAEPPRDTLKNAALFIVVTFALVFIPLLVIQFSGR